MNVLRTERLTLTPRRVRDTPRMVKLFRDDTVREFFGRDPGSLWKTLAVVLRGTVAARLAARARRPSSGNYRFWTIRERASGDIAGSCALTSRPRGGIQITYMLFPNFRGRGIATEAARAVLDFAFDELSLDNVAAIVADRNLSSLRVVEKLGMSREGEIEIGGSPHGLYVLTRQGIGTPSPE